MTAVEVSKNASTPPVDALAELVDDEFIARLAGQARARGLSLVGAAEARERVTFAGVDRSTVGALFVDVADQRE